MSEPLRMCVVCRKMLPKTELTRVALNKEGGIAPDRTGKAPGRGAYICRSAECRAKSVKSKALSRAFKREVPREVYEELLNEKQ